MVFLSKLISFLHDLNWINDNKDEIVDGITWLISLCILIGSYTYDNIYFLYVIIGILSGYVLYLKKKCKKTISLDMTIQKTKTYYIKVSDISVKIREKYGVEIESLYKNIWETCDSDAEREFKINVNNFVDALLDHPEIKKINDSKKKEIRKYKYDDESITFNQIYSFLNELNTLMCLRGQS